jgi:hypothetical protein
MQDLIAATSILFTTYKKIKELCEKADNIELKKYILEMNEQILTMKELCLELREENNRLKEEIIKLTALSEKELVLKDNALYDRDGNGPYCPNCYENKKRLKLMAKIGTRIYKYLCTECKYGIK